MLLTNHFIRSCIWSRHIRSSNKTHVEDKIQWSWSHIKSFGFIAIPTDGSRIWANTSVELNPGHLVVAVMWVFNVRWTLLFLMETRQLSQRSRDSKGRDVMGASCKSEQVRMSEMFWQCFVQSFGSSVPLIHFFVLSSSEEEIRLFRHFCSECYLVGQTSTGSICFRVGSRRPRRYTQ